MHSSFTRRSLVSTAPAVLLAATIPACARADPDDALLALRAPWLASVADFNAALEQKSVLDAQAHARFERYPDFKAFAGGKREYNATLARIRDAREAIEAEVGCPEADQVVDEKGAANIAMVDRIAEIPAHTLAGLAFKVEVSEDWQHGREELIDSIMADILAQAKGEPDA